MDLMDVMLKRRSVREYEEKEITKEQLNKILQAALLAPTSRNRKPCKFLVVSNKKTLKKLSQCKNTGAQFLEGCNKAVVVISDENIADTWIEDSSIALTYMHLMATNLGLGSCWVQMHLRDKNGSDSEKLVCKALEINNKYRVVGIMALGVAKTIPDSHSLNELDNTKIQFLN
ncbi:nitroreductase family protein [uncultured Methanobrevibacter sp.]|uniref:nitroreductase family protein n=1 Tax=uncultured Methanobrevibacter sp. TaxID=253161 RepID=UPI0025D267F2|nr:nitroreductase family protein [uncultured Methanobrevibacter sp.]